MALWSRLLSLWRNLFRKEQVEKELAEEVQTYLEMLIDAKIRQGLEPEVARRLAVLEMGGVEQVKEQVREVRMGQLLETIAQDLRYGARMLRKRPGFTAVAVLTLALGSGATSAIFSIFNIFVLNPFPFSDSSRIYLLRQSLPKIGVKDQFRASGPEYAELAQIQAFERIAAWESVSRNLTGSEQAERVAAAKVSSDFFSLLGIEPILGRTIRPEEVGDSAARVLVISHALWQRRFAGDTNVIGQRIALDDEPYTIIGVMPPNFQFDGGDAWFPFPMHLHQLGRSGRAFAVLARLKSGTSTAQAASELEILARQQERDFASANPDYENRTYHLQPISEFYYGPLQTALFILFAAVGLVLLIACANIANLLLAQATSRSHELAIRQALGAGRARLLRQLLMESLLLAFVGGALGLLLAFWGTGALVAMAPSGTFPPGLEIPVNSRVLLFSLLITLATAVLFGLLPALRTSGGNLQQAMQTGAQRSTAGQRHRRTQNLLVMAEVSLSLILLVMAGLMIRSFSRLTNVDPGFRTDNLMTMRVNRSPAKSDGGKQMAPFFQQVIEKVKTTPGVEGVAVASHMPFVFTEDWALTVESEAVPVDLRTPSIDTRTVSSDYFSVMGIPFFAGESFAEAADVTPVVLINRTMANRYWLNEDVIGKRLKIGNADSKSPWFTIKGVVADSAQGTLDAETRPEVYFSLSQMASRYRRMNLVIRTTGEPKALLSAIQQRIQEVDKDQPVYQVQTIQELLAESIGTRRFAMLLLILFAGIAMVMAFIGIYGVISYGVSQRQQELGIRMALGASQRDVLRLILRQGMIIVAAGLVIGLLAAFWLTRLMANLLFNVSATDPLTFFALSLILAGVALLACYVPARRATKVNPMTALRTQ